MRNHSDFSYFTPPTYSSKKAMYVYIYSRLCSVFVSVSFLKNMGSFCSSADPSGKLPEETLDAASLKTLFSKKGFS